MGEPLSDEEIQDVRRRLGDDHLWHDVYPSDIAGLIATIDALTAELATAKRAVLARDELIRAICDNDHRLADMWATRLVRYGAITPDAASLLRSILEAPNG